MFDYAPLLGFLERIPLNFVIECFSYLRRRVSSEPGGEVGEEASEAGVRI